MRSNGSDCGRAIVSRSCFRIASSGSPCCSPVQRRARHPGTGEHLPAGLIIRHQLADTGSAMMLTDHLGFAQLRPLLDELPQLQRLIFVGEEPLPISTISGMAAILATSGTTGPSRGRMISNGTGRTAVATGASSGLGMRFSRVLAQAGATVFALARRAALLKTLAAKQPGIEHVACDVADHARLAHVTERMAPVDVLVNNAGVGGASRSRTNRSMSLPGFWTSIWSQPSTRAVWWPRLRPRRHVDRQCRVDPGPGCRPSAGWRVPLPRALIALPRELTAQWSTYTTG